MKLHSSLRSITLTTSLNATNPRIINTHDRFARIRDIIFLFTSSFSRLGGSPMYSGPDVPQTYLNPDGFLGGLNLNRENTTLRPDYENILRFYGFDLTIDLSNFTAESASNFGLKSSMTTTMLPTELPAMQTLGTTLMPGMTDGTMPPTTMPAIIAQSDMSGEV